MISTSNRIIITLLFIVCVAICLAINYIPRGNFIGAPIITLYVYIPLLIVQIILLINVWQAKNKEKIMKKSLLISLLITTIFIYFLYDYLKGTS